MDLIGGLAGIFFFFLNSRLLSLTVGLPDIFYLLCAYHRVPYKLDYSVCYYRIMFGAMSTPLPMTTACTQITLKLHVVGSGHLQRDK